MTQRHPLSAVSERLQTFADKREWQQFHSPKNLTMALMVEVGELLEHFQWLTEQASAELDPVKLSEVAKEIADVQIYLIRLADVLGVDIMAATESKMTENEAKYPADKVKGSSKKYTEY